jgi:hypothetical protein
VKRKRLQVLALLAPLALVYGCSKAPAEAAINSAQQAVDTARPLAEKFVPQQMKSLTDALADARDRFGKGDYSGALAAAKDIPMKANEVVAAAKAKKEELTKAWEGLSKDVTASLGAVTAKISELTAMKKLPKGMDKAKVEGAKAALDSANQAWAEAAEAAKSDKWPDALKKASEVKAKAQEIMGMLGMPGEPGPAK